MPWTIGGDLPEAVSSLSQEDKEQWVAVANKLLEEGYSEAEAIPLALEEVQPADQGTEKSRLVKAFKDFVDKHFGETNKPTTPSAEVTKAVQEEQRMALFVVLEPDTYDLHKDIYSAEEVEKACNNFNMHCDKANLFHCVETENAHIVQSYTAPCDFTLDTGKEIKKGTWLQWWYFPEDEIGDKLWNMVKSGDINGVSIGGRAIIEDIEE